MVKHLLRLSFFVSTVVFTSEIAFAAPSPASQAQSSSPANITTSSITFGSCLRQWESQPVWHSIARLKPEAFIFLGDNMYADVGDYLNRPEPQRIADAYAELQSSLDFQAFREASREQEILWYATWDDHDYGRNDSGADYPHKLAAKHYFLDFFNLTSTSSGDASQPGIYQSQRLQLQGLDIQLVLLDTRSFRSPLKKDPDAQCSRTKTVANMDPDATILGDQQWQWLEQQLRQPADLRLLASSIQVIPEQHCFEKWANFPNERERLFQLIKATNANGVVIISGDRHMAEISQLPTEEIGYPLYEITASGLNSAMGFKALLNQEQNRYRYSDNIYDDNFGAITLEKNSQGHTLALQIYTAKGEIALQKEVTLSSLRVN